VMTAPKKLRRDSERTLLLRLRNARRNGVHDVRTYGRKRRVLLSILLLLGALTNARDERSGTQNEEQQ